MKPKLSAMTKWLDGRVDRLQRRLRRARPGSVLIMVVALLVLLALMGTAYLATARQDRISAGQIRDNGIAATANRVAADAIAQAGTWLTANASQTFTTSAVGSDPQAQMYNYDQRNNKGNTTFVEAGLAGPLIAPRIPDLAPVGPPLLATNPSGPYTSDPLLNNGSDRTLTNEAYHVRWKHVTVPPGYTRFASPIVSPNANNRDNNFDNLPIPIPPQTTPQLQYYSFNDAQDWAVPTSMTLTYPAKDYTGTQALAGQTRTYPAFMKYTWDQAHATTLISGPYLAADTTGAGIADAGLVQLDLPSVNGVQWFAAWRIVDNAAAVNLNTAWGPYPYPSSPPSAPLNNASGAANCDALGNAFNFFPTDVDLYGFLNTGFNTTALPPSEMATLQARRVAPAILNNPTVNSDNGPYWTTFFSDNGQGHSDVSYLYRGEAMWWHLGRRLDNPLPNVAGDYQDGYRRPFTDTDTIALSNRGGMCDPTSPQSKVEQIFFQANSTNSADSLYRSAINYMLNAQDRFSVLPANAVGYWYDWNFNFEGLSFGSLYGGGADGRPLGIGLPAATNLPYDSFGIGALLGQVNFNGTPPWSTGNAKQASTAWFQSTFRTPRALTVGANPTLNVARQVDPKDWPDVTQTLNVGGANLGALAPPPVAMTAYTAASVPRKVPLNTAKFEDLWRAFGNVFNDFRTEDGTTATGATGSVAGTYHLHLMRDPVGYDLRDAQGPNGVPVVNKPSDPTNPYINPRQLRNPMRDPNTADSVSTNNTCPANANGTVRAWLDSRNTAALRAAIAAVNVLTMREQHGAMIPDLSAVPYFSPFVAKRSIQLDVQTGQSGATTAHPVTAMVYGGAPQPYIAEVYVSTDNSDHGTPSGGGSDQQNKNGLVVIKLYNPYPFPISMQGYDLAVMDRTNFSNGLTGAGQKMGVTLISRPLTGPNANPTPGFLFLNNATPPAPISIPGNGYLLLTNYDKGTGYWPQYSKPGWPAATEVDPAIATAPVCIIPGLSDVIGLAQPADPTVGSPLTQNGGELILLRSLSPNGGAAGQPITNPQISVTQPEVPVDSFDFTGMKLDTSNAANYYAWHYLRMSGRTNDVDNVTAGGKATPWKFIYPGAYSGNGTFTNPKKTAAPGYSGPKPHYVDTDVAQWSSGASPPTKDPWDQDTTNTMAPSTIYNNQNPTWHMDLTQYAVSSTATYANPFPGIQIFNIDFGGFNKRAPNATSVFPYGGFARVGDVQQVPFVGSYVIFDTNVPTPTMWPPVVPKTATDVTMPAVTVSEVNPVTVDTCYADDGDPADDAYEQVGRFVPLVDPGLLANGPTGVSTVAVNDLAPSGAYVANPQQAFPPLLEGPNPDVAPPNAVSAPAGGTVVSNMPTWRYHFALEALNQFTVIASPVPGSSAVAAPGSPVSQDLFPNFSADSWYQAAVAPQTTPTAITNTGWAGVDGLINVNTADWRTLAAVEMIPRAQDPDGSLNRRLAKAIVYYRDVDDGILHQQLQWNAATPPGQWVTVNGFAYRRGHGPFNSLAELNNVWEPTPGAAATLGFRNAMGKLTGGTAVNTSALRRQWGYYTPGGPNPTANLASADLMIQSDDWLAQNLMVDRVSNLLTTRSDSFTVYVVIQGWRNPFNILATGTQAPPWPELVVQKRMAMTVDRSVLTPTSTTLKTTPFPTK